jgi:raffinose/stachyose/melibiose transport system substrate-binding protein
MKKEKAMIKMKKVLAMLLTGIMVVSMVGCGNSTTETTTTEDTKESTQASVAATTEDASATEDVTITIASRYGSDVPDEEYFRSKIQEFNDLDNGITVEMDSIPTESDYLDNLRTNFASGDTPNVFTEYGGSRTLDYLEADALLDMSPYYEADPDWYNSFSSAVWDKLSYDGYDGIWGVPFKAYTIALFYNKDIFAANGLEAPESFDDLLKCCETLKAAGIKPFQVGESDIWRLGHFSNNLIIKSFGVGAVKELSDRTLAYDSDEIVGTFKIIQDMVEKGYFGDDILTTDYTSEKSAYAAGECAMRWDGSWYVGEIAGTETSDMTGAVAFPYINEKYKDNAQGSASDMWFISKLNKSDAEIAASVELVKFLTSEDYYKGNYKASCQLFPVTYDYMEGADENPLMDQVKDIANSMTEMRDDIQTYDQQSDMLDTVRNALQGIAMGNTAEECAAQIMERIEEQE